MIVSAVVQLVTLSHPQVPEKYGQLGSRPKRDFADKKKKTELGVSPVQHDQLAPGDDQHHHRHPHWRLQDTDNPLCPVKLCLHTLGDLKCLYR